ncbi:pseudouridine synthase [Bacteroidota bacterium]
MKPSSKSGKKYPGKKGSSKTGSGSGKADFPSGSPNHGKTSFREKPFGPGIEGRRTTASGSWKANPGTKPSPTEKEAPKGKTSDSEKAVPKGRTSGSGKATPREKSSDSGKVAARGKPSSSWKAPARGRGSVPAREAGRKKGQVPEQVSPSGVRLNRFIANSGVCSRREADELIQSGSIEVNGKIVSELGTRVGSSDSVRYNGKLLKGERKVYVLLNKPKDCVTTVKDTHGRNTVMDLVRGCCTERIYPVGRLDRNTTGVLLLTNDGELTDTLSHPSFNKKKIYHIHLDRALSNEDMKQLRDGFELEDGFIKPDRIEYVDAGDKKQVGLEIHSGRNRIVRRMFEFLDYKVLRLDRVYFAGLTKKGLSRGRWRHLSEKEVNTLKMSIPGKKAGRRPTKF